MVGFSTGQHRVLISKQKICGWGMNWQHCAHQAFVGVNDSYEGFYQAVRRSWRFGQRRPVNIHVSPATRTAPLSPTSSASSRPPTKCMRKCQRIHWMQCVNPVLGARKNTNDYNASRRVAVPSFLVAA